MGFMQKNVIYDNSPMQEICEKSKKLLKFLTFLAILHLSFYARIFLALPKKREMQYARNVRNNRIQEILFLLINRMQEICEKIEKFEKCDNYCTCLMIIDSIMANLVCSLLSPFVQNNYPRRGPWLSG